MLHPPAERGYANMPSVRVVGSLACAALAAALAGCAGARFSEDAPAGVNLTGSWRLDHAASDDPDKILHKMRAEAFRLMGRRAGAPEPRPGMRGGAAGVPQGPSAEDEVASQEARGVRIDPLQRSPMAHVITETVARGDFLTIRQSPGQLVLDYGGTRRSFTPGQHSVVSTEGGVGDQTSGWKGREYVIELRAQMGPAVTERYGLSSDGTQLIEKLHIGAAELHAVDLRRVYERRDGGAPRQVPTSD
jgi:hypothetical protein